MAKNLASINRSVADGTIVASPQTSVKVGPAKDDVATVGATTASGSTVVTGSGSVSIEYMRLARTTDTTNTGATIQNGSDDTGICVGD